MNVEINCLNRKASGLLQVSQKRLEKQRQSIAKFWGEPWMSQMCPQKTMGHQKIQDWLPKIFLKIRRVRKKKRGSVKSETFQKVEKQVLQKDRAGMFEYLPYVSTNFLQKTMALQGGQPTWFPKGNSYYIRYIYYIYILYIYIYYIYIYICV